MRILPGLAVALLSLASCRGPQERTPLVVNLDRFPATLDPYHHNEVVGWSLLCNFYDALVRFSPEMRVEPSLAESWEVLDGNRVRFSLRRDARFSDGEPFSSADVVASFDRALHDPLSKVRHHLIGIRRVTADGAGAVVIETDSPSPTLLNRLPFLFIVPRSQATVKEILRPVGTGPYRFVERTNDGSVVAEGWASWRGMPEIRRVIFSFVENEDRRSDRFIAGGIDVTYRLVDDVLADVKRHPGLRVQDQPYLMVQLLVVVPQAATGEARLALSDPRVRRAMLMAINRDRLISRVFRGNGSVASQYVHPVVFGYDVALSPVPYDLPQARRLLSQAGFPRGFSVELAHGSVSPDYLAGIAADLGALGVRVTTRALALSELLQRARKRELPFFTYGRSCTTGDASEFLDSSIHTEDLERGLGLENYAGYSDRESDALLEAADTEMDTARRLELLQRVQRRVLASLPLLPLTIKSEYVGLSSRVEIPVRFDGWMWADGFGWRR